MRSNTLLLYREQVRSFLEHYMRLIAIMGFRTKLSILIGRHSTNPNLIARQLHLSRHQLETPPY